MRHVCGVATTVATAVAAAALCAHARPATRVGGSTVLPWGDINIVSVTDVHGWVDGHRHPDNTPPLDADFGDLVSFRDHVEADADARGKDVLYLNSGDLVDGRGITDATSPKGKVMFKLLQQLPIDAYVIGNHELYDASTARELADSGLVSWLDGGYLTGNVVWATGPDEGHPVGARWKVWKGPRTGVRVLLLGFLYDFDEAARNTRVVPVERALKESWVEAALRHEPYDAVVVLAHMDNQNPLVGEIVGRVRETLPGVPCAVLAGHTHVRAFHRVDANAAVLEAGKYFDTIGWVSFDAAAATTAAAAAARNASAAAAAPSEQAVTPAVARRDAGADTSSEDSGTAAGTPQPPAAAVAAAAAAAAATEFHHVFIDANKAELARRAGVDPDRFATASGKRYSDEIDAAITELGLHRAIGCAPRGYRMDAEFGDSDSLYGLMMREVLPAALFEPPRNASLVVIQSVGSLRYNIYPGKMTVDDTITVSPFGDSYDRIAALTGDEVEATLGALVAAPVTSTAIRVGADVLGPWVHSAFAKGAHVAFDVVVQLYDRDKVLAAARAATRGRVTASEPYRRGDRNTTYVWEAFIESEWPLPCS